MTILQLFILWPSPSHSRHFSFHFFPRPPRVRVVVREVFLVAGLLFTVGWGGLE